MGASVLIPLDGSKLSERVLGPLGPFLQEQKAEVTLLRVVAPRISKEEEAEVMAQAAEQLGRVAGVLEKQDIDVSQRLEPGDPAERILEVTRELRPDLLAMSTHGRTGLKRIFRGSVAERVLRKCPVPLFLCNPHAIERAATGARFRRILVPLDGSPRADAILALVQEWATTYGSDVTLFRVEPIRLSEVSTPVLDPVYVLDEWDEERTKGSLKLQRKGLTDAGVTTHARAARGVEVTEILAAAKEADLVAMTTHGRGGISRWWLGSVAESVIRHCPCPLLLLRPQR